MAERRCGRHSCVQDKAGGRVVGLQGRAVCHWIPASPAVAAARDERQVAGRPAAGGCRGVVGQIQEVAEVSDVHAGCDAVALGGSRAEVEFDAVTQGRVGGYRLHGGGGLRGACPALGSRATPGQGATSGRDSGVGGSLRVIGQPSRTFLAGEFDLVPTFLDSVDGLVERVCLGRSRRHRPASADTPPRPSRRPPCATGGDPPKCRRLRRAVRRREGSRELRGTGGRRRLRRCRRSGLDRRAGRCGPGGVRRVAGRSGSARNSSPLEWRLQWRRVRLGGGRGGVQGAMPAGAPSWSSTARGSAAGVPESMAQRAR